MAVLRLPTPNDVRRLRKGAGLTQKKLAEKAGVSQSLIARIEKGSVDPRLSTLRKILNAITITRQEKTAYDIMHSPVISVNATDPVRKAVDLMRKYDISQMPILKDGKIIGSIQESTIIKKILLSNEPKEIFKESIQKVMEEPFPMISPSTSVADLLMLFSRGLPAVLVMDKSKLVGIVTKIDLVSAAV